MKLKRGFSILVLLSILMVVVSGCLGAQLPKGTTVVQILPNQTAFLLPAKGETSAQTSFDSAAYLDTKKVASKIVEISYTKHDLGLSPNNFDWTPNELLVIVDRSPISRQWLKSGDATASAADAAIGLESKESIGFYHGVALNASIQEEDSATFLYWFGGSVAPNADSKTTGILYSVSLQNVIDTVVKSWVAKELYSEFKQYILADDQINAAAVFSRVEAKAKEFFKTYGITIISLGGVQGLVYDSKEVQDNIDKTFSAQSLATVQGIDNAKNIAKANADAQVLQINAEAQAKANQLIGDSLSKNPLIINKTLADKSVGAVPQVLVLQNDGTQLPFPFFYTLPTATPTPVVSPK